MRRVQRDGQILSTIWTRTQEANIWHRLDEQEDGALGREAEGARGDGALALLTQSFQAPHPLSLANWNSQNSVLAVMFLQPTHSRVITISFLHGAFPWEGWRGGRSPACAWNTGSPLPVGPSTFEERDYFDPDLQKVIYGFLVQFRNSPQFGDLG